MSDFLLAAALERCLRLVRRGEPVEAVLRAYAAHRPELDALLLTAMRLDAMPAVEPSPATRASMRAKLTESIAREPRSAGASPEKRPILPALRLGPVWRVAVPVVASVLAIAVFLGLTAVRQGEAPASTTVLTILEGEVLLETARGLVPGQSGMTVNPGDRILTEEGSRAVITFFDGSTMVIEPRSDVTVSSVDNEDGRLQAVITQAQGSTWTHIPAALGEAEVEIETPNARVETRQASVQTTVGDGGQTQVGATDGSIAVESATARTEVPSGFNTLVEQPGNVTQPQPAAAPARELVLRIEGPAFALLSAPGQASVGTIAPGVPVNQVPGARVERSDGGSSIYLPEPPDGIYKLTLTAAGDGPVRVSATVRNGGTDAIATSLGLGASETAGVSFALQKDDLTMLSAVKQPVSVPEQVVVPPAAVDKANASAQSTPAARDTVPPTPTRTPTPQPTATEEPSPTLEPSPTPKRPPTQLTAVPAPSDTDAQLGTNDVSQ